ncbi:hypothetical protein WA026_020705 [Henosepilachna vigintioctopunctata]|uniref:lysozyme n=1 Tax=Henosepilachna vigintioctopunctata TaxID=420089 RepID=A0AAW1U520_9CUCU
MTKKLAAVCFLIFVSFGEAKIYKRCELASELLHIHKIAVEEIPVWVCIAKHESVFNTSAVNRGSGDHGLFQISDLYWCSKEGQGRACNAACSSFEDDDIEDDVQCIRRIYNEHKRLSGNGFNAWVVYPLYCDRDVQTYIADCFDLNTIKTTTISTIPTTEGEEEYEFPPLPVFPKLANTSALKTNVKYPKIVLKTSSQKSEVTSTSRSEVSMIRRMPHKLNTKFLSVYSSWNLGYYDPNEPKTSRKNEGSFETFNYNKAGKVILSSHDLKNVISKNNKPTSTTKLHVVSTFIPKAIKKQTVHITPAKSKSESSRPLQLNESKYTENVQTSRPSNIFTSNSRKGREQSVSYQRTKIDSHYIIERNGRGGFRLTLE